MGQLIPRDYEYYGGVDQNGIPIPSSKVSAGLTGDLALLLGLAAFSAPPNSQRAALTNSVQPGVWRPHNFPSGRKLNLLDEVSCSVHIGIPERGMIISIYLDPTNTQGSTKEVLNAIKEGNHGPFYGP